MRPREGPFTEVLVELEGHGDLAFGGDLLIVLVPVARDVLLRLVAATEGASRHCGEREAGDLPTGQE